MVQACVASQLRSRDQAFSLYIQHALLMAPVYLQQSVRLGPWPCRPENEILLPQDQEIPAISSKCRIVERANMAPI